MAHRKPAGPMIGTFLNCGCAIHADGHGINWCPTHDAAPDLLEALRDMLKADTAICEDSGTKADQAMLRIAAIDAAEVAIAKATGKGA